jgi:hypothetical protein
VRAIDNTEEPTQRADNMFFDSSIILKCVEYVYTLVLLVTFIAGAAWYSIVNARKEEDVVQPQVKGPGGKPLPPTKRKKRDNDERKIGPHFRRVAKDVFRTLAAGVFLSYVASSAFILYHAFVMEDPYTWTKNGLPWAGEWTAVSDRHPSRPDITLIAC